MSLIVRFARFALRALRRPSWWLLAWSQRHVLAGWWRSTRTTVRDELARRRVTASTPAWSARGPLLAAEADPVDIAAAGGRRVGS